MTQLYLLRHAHAGNPDEWTGNDADRPLSAKGRRQSQLLGRFLAERGFKPATILTSPKIRAVQTAELVAKAVAVRVETDHRLAARLDLELVSTMLADAGERVVLVGHDPDFSDLAAALTGASYLPLKKGALARIDVNLPLEDGAGTLRWLVPPDLLSART